MAIWQVDYEGIPDSWLLRPPGQVRDFLDKNGCLDTENFWNSSYDCRAILKMLDNSFTRIESWHPEVLIWSVKGDTRIELICQDAVVNSLRFRFDVRSLEKETVNKVLNFALAVGLCFYSFARRILLPASFDVIWQDIRTSKDATLT